MELWEAEHLFGLAYPDKLGKVCKKEKVNNIYLFGIRSIEGYSWYLISKEKVSKRFNSIEDALSEL